MDSGQREIAAAKWTDLPAEFFPIIHRNLATCRQIIRFRSVCRRWRSSTPPQPNKLSGIFPLRPSFLDKPDRRYDFVIYASAVYLVRSRSDPSNAWMVSVQESSAGNLVLRHPLFYKQISNSPAVDVADSIYTTQTLISRSYAYNERCRYCNQIAGTKKVAIVRESSSPSNSSGSGSGSSQLVGLCAFPIEDLVAFKMEVTDCTTTTIATQFHRNFVDFATFNGRIFAVDKEGQIFAVEHASLYLIQLNSIARPSNASLYFVVSDGDLYLVSLHFHANPPTCLIYRLQVSNNNENEVSMELEKVEDLGDDRVFFIGKTCSFSVPARDLPPPCKGNCIVFGDIPRTICECKTFCTKPDPAMFMLGGQNPRYEAIQPCFLSLMLQLN